ncbi:hypothetical protein SDRG_08340 [Saprolegnia diclina VS20]|uniref:6-phosphogluconolactonase n=1 Tax=Saprolegnia diclina (strain VS20) TaxID=1156394 RepID=T0QHB0_SAPDV|nr:hypothetical protein SDRG_08340 [Saprolegnia diclina VS20]EQC34131.1 hypothetical protein SDRG_08340 [Saprolegnia diclina VS20]|eukprot:XP_008612443.1 hypothetical protein SDRG_08340 [Saprolegnia diclina VS20]
MKPTLVLSLLALVATVVQSSLLFVGSQTSPTSSVGLSVFANENGRLRKLLHETTTTTGEMPTYMAVSHDSQFLYLTNEIDAGSVTSFRIARAGDSVELKALGTAPTKSKGPVHVTVTKSGRFLLVASYSVGSITVLGVDGNGFANSVVDQVTFEGGAHVVPGRQDGPHAHCVALSPDNKFAFVTDLGNDKIMQFKFDAASGKLTPNAPAFVALGRGALPRHLAFHPNGRDLYLNTEQSNELIQFQFNATSGTLRQKKSVKTTTKASGVFTGALHVAPSGKHVLVSNRWGNDDSLVVFSADLTKRIGSYPTQASGAPRDFTIANGTVFVGNENTNSIDSFTLHANGQLTHHQGQATALFKPQVLLPY